MTALGFNVVIDLSKSDLPYASSGTGALDSFAAKNPNTVLVVIASVLEAQEMIFANPTKAAEYWATYAQLDKTKAQTVIQGFLPQGNRSLMFPKSSFAFVQKVMSTVTPGIMTVDVSQAFDQSYLKKLVDIGFYKKIGAPVPNPIPS
jgi:hypothetical protein